MEVSNESFTIVVDSKKFVAHPEAEITLKGALAMLSYVAVTGEHRKVIIMITLMLNALIGGDKRPPKSLWSSDDKGWAE